jgi:hypothetical protein
MWWLVLLHEKILKRQLVMQIVSGSIKFGITSFELRVIAKIVQCNLSLKHNKIQWKHNYMIRLSQTSMHALLYIEICSSSRVNTSFLKYNNFTLWNTCHNDKACTKSSPSCRNVYLLESTQFLWNSTISSKWYICHQWQQFSTL